ncbi:MAG TPA: hypothetical protein VF122_00780 [Caulobacteraceae bacterium]
MGKASAFAYLFLAAPLLLAGCNQPPAENDTAPVEAPPDTAANPSPTLTADATDEQMITSAESAAPPAVAKAATIVAMGEDGSMRELRKGTNGFTCMADNPVTPGPDPMCADANAMEFINAWATHATPAAEKVGFMYMLAGGTDASNVDPYASAPTEGNSWVQTGPHVMIVGSKAALAGYPTSPTPNTSQPYVMWADTPYAHLMIPVS